MNYQHYDLGYKNRGQSITVTLQGNAANVRLMNNSNFQKYRRGAKFQFFGGLAEKTTTRLEIPHTDAWHLVVDLLGLSGSVRSSVSV